MDLSGAPDRWPARRPFVEVLAEILGATGRASSQACRFLGFRRLCLPLHRHGRSPDPVQRGLRRQLASAW